MIIGIDSVKGLVGNKVPFDKWSERGSPKTLEGTDNQYWVVYFRFRQHFFRIKQTDRRSFEEKSAINYLNDIKQKRRELIEKQLSEWDSSHIELTKIIKKL